MERDELATWLRLQLTPGVGCATANKLVRAFGSPHAVFAQSQAQLREHVTVALAQALAKEPDDCKEALDRSWAWLNCLPDHARILTLTDAHYPQALHHISDPPLLLFALAAPHVWCPESPRLTHARCLAVVGSRNPTAQGAENARLFARALSQAGLTIVSGLALGIDGMAHEGALEHIDAQQLHTIAVVGTGLDRVYPRQHRALAHRICQHGMLLSEYTPGTAPRAIHFPRRNRIIAGMSFGALVVEATLKSGSLITAELACEGGKEVFAIPGSIHSVQSRGCHALIRQGAKLVECAQDVLEELERIAPQQCKHYSAPPPPTTSPSPVPTESPLLQALGYDPVNLDTLQQRTGLPTASLLAQLMELELQGHLARLAGGMFQRIALA